MVRCKGGSRQSRGYWGWCVPTTVWAAEKRWKFWLIEQQKQRRFSDLWNRSWTELGWIRHGTHYDSKRGFWLISSSNLPWMAMRNYCRMLWERGFLKALQLQSRRLQVCIRPLSCETSEYYCSRRSTAGGGHHISGALWLRPPRCCSHDSAIKGKTPGMWVVIVEISSH